MSESELVHRLRRNLPREYGIKVMFIGVPVLGLRIPRNSVSELTSEDNGILYDQLYSNMDQIRPDEIRDVYIIADSDYLQMDPQVFFRPILGVSDSAVADVIRNTQEEIPDDDAIILSDDVAEPESAVVTDFFSEDDPERSAFAGLLEPEAEDNDAVSEDEAYLLIDEPDEVVEAVEDIEEFSFEEPRSVSFEEETLTTPAKVCLYEPEICVELTPKEYVHVLSHDELEDDLGVSSAHERSASEKLMEDLKDDKTVGKILNDFARNSQKKRLAAGRLKSGRRAEVLTKSKRGRYVRYRMPGEKITDIAIAPTVRAAAHHAKDGKIEIRKSDIREKVRRRRISSLINIVFDTSGSMDETEKVQITTSVVLALLKDAYQRRDRVSLVTYSGRSGELVLPFTSSVEAAKRYLEKVPFGGTTPMASGLLRGLDTLVREVKKEPSAVPIMILVTDGTANSPLHLGGNIKREIRQICNQISDHHVNLLVVDISNTGSRLAKEVAMHSNGSYYHPRSLSKEALYSAIKQERDQKTAFATV